MPPSATLSDPATRRPSLWESIRKIDSGYLIIMAIIAGVVVLAPKQLVPTLRYAGKSLLTMLPLMIAAFTLNAYLKAADANNVVMGIFAGRTRIMVVAAALLGGLSPLCSCSVIPMIVVLLQAGVPLGPIMAFWMSSPIVSPDTYAMTVAVLGLPLATARLVSAIGVGLVAGFATMALQRTGMLARPLHPRLLLLKGGQSFSANSGRVKAHWRFWTEPARRQVFADELWATAKLLVTWMVIAFLLESLMLTYVPNDWIAGLFGSQNIFSIPLAALIGIPLYINGIAAIPLVKGFVHAGMSPGAALAFIVGGAVTSIPAIMAVLPIVRRPVFFWYVMVAIAAASISGFLYQTTLSLVGH